MSNVMPIEKPEENLLNAGLIFVFTVWLQGQMSDLIIFKRNPHLIADFVSSPKKLPKAFFELRVGYWEKQFGSVKEEFAKLFDGDLSAEEKQDLEELYHLRNMIGHAHVSMGRDYMLYRPSGGAKKEDALINALRTPLRDDQANPLMFKLEFWRHENFKRVSDKIENFDQVCLRRLAEFLGVPHGRIR